MWKVFQNNTALTAEDLNDVLLEQAVITFADATARSNAIPSPNPGMHCHLLSTKRTYYYDAANGWIELMPGTVSGLTQRGLLVCTSTTRPAHAAGRLIYETDTKVTQISDGTSWTPLTAPIMGKMWRTAGSQALTLAGYTTIGMGAGRASGGVIWDSAFSRLQIPIDGMYRVTNRFYITGSDGQVMFTVSRARATVADADIATAMTRKQGGDEQGSMSDVLPLKGGDYIWQRGYAYSSGISAFGNGEVSTSAITVEYVGPLNGATPV